MSRRIVQAIDLIAFTTLVVASLMIAAGMAHAQDQASASARKTDRPAVTTQATPTATVAAPDPARQTTVLVRTTLY